MPIGPRSPRPELHRGGLEAAPSARGAASGSRRFDFVGMTILPNKTHSPLVVDPNAVLPLPICSESFQTIAGRHPQVVQVRSSVDLDQLP